jgi:hypothetical protein
MSATTKKLDYADVPPRASSSRSLRTEVLPSSGSSFNMNNTIIFDLPSNVSNTFWDAQSSYVRLNFTNNDGAAVNFEGGGFPTCIRRIEMLLGGQTLCSIDSYNVLYQMLFDLDTAGQFRSNAGARLFGSANSAVGEQVAAAGVRTVCFPLALCPIIQSSKYWPLFGREPLRIRIELDTAARGLIGAATDAEITIDEVALVMYQLELGNDVMSQVASNSGGMMRIAMPSYQHHQATLAAGASSVATTLGFSMSSLNRVLVAQRLQAVTAANVTIGNRSQCNLTDANVKIGGIQYPQIALKDRNDDGAETLAEALVSQRALLTWGHDSSIELGAGFNANEPTGANNTNTGHYLIDLDLESQRVDAGSLVAGVNCIGQVVQFESTYDAGVTAAHVLDIFGEFTLMAMLDLNSLTWSIAV